jgi:potassium efflux system protein
LRGCARETPGVAQQPAPDVLFTGFGASSLDFVVRAWTSDFDAWPQIRSDVATRIHAALENAQIQIPFPQRDLHLRSVSQEAAVALTAPRQEEARPLAAD